MRNLARANLVVAMDDDLVHDSHAHSKHQMKHTLILAAIVSLSSCTSIESPSGYKFTNFAVNSKMENVEFPDGTKYASIDTNRTEGVRHVSRGINTAVAAIGSAYAVGAQAAVEEAKNAATAATAQKSIDAASKAQQTATRAAVDVAPLVTNPELNGGALPPVIEAFKR